MNVSYWALSLLLARFPNAHLGESSCVHMIIICPHRNGTLFPVWTLTRVSVIRKDGVRKGRKHNVASLEWMGTFDTMSYGCVIILSLLLSLSYTSRSLGINTNSQSGTDFGRKKKSMTYSLGQSMDCCDGRRHSRRWRGKWDKRMQYRGMGA